jgi:hypothetical protein
VLPDPQNGPDGGADSAGPDTTNRAVPPGD